MLIFGFGGFMEITTQKDGSLYQPLITPLNSEEESRFLLGKENLAFLFTTGPLI